MTSETTHDTMGPPTTAKDNILERGAAATQNFGPIKAICAHLNAFHVYASDPSRSVEANHYCTHLSSDVRPLSLTLPVVRSWERSTNESEQVRQCLIYDAPSNPARLIGVEYMITPRLYETLDKEERLLWHSHDYEARAPHPTFPFHQATITGSPYTVNKNFI